MDLAELGIIYVSEGAEAAIAKMEEFKNASAEVVQTDEERVKAAGKVSTATSSLTEQITRSIIAYQGSKSAQYEFQAISLGANNALAQQIELLRTLEQMEQLATQTAKELASDRKREADAAKSAAAAAEKAEQAKWDALIKSADARAKDIALYTQQEAERVAIAKKAEQDIADAKNKALLQTMNDRQKMIDLYTKQEKERVAQEQRTATQLAATQKKTTDDAIKAAEQKALSEMAWAKKSRDEQIRIKEEIAAYRSAGISDKTISGMVGSGALSGTVKEVESLSEKWHNVSMNTSRARSEMVVLAHEALQGRFSRIPASMMVFAEYTDLSSLALSGMGLAVIGTVAALAGLTIAMVKGLLEQRELQNALIMTGNYAGTTEGQLNLLAHTSTALGGSIGVAKDVILELAASGRFTADQISAIVPAIVRMEDATGGGKEAVAKLVGEFKSLAVEANAHSRYSDEVSKAVLKLDNEYHFLTASVFAQIRALEAEGQTKEASALATTEFAKVTESRAKEIAGNLGSIEKGWRHIKEAIGEAWSAMKDWGKTETIQGKLEAAAKKIEDLADPTIKIGHQTINLGTDHRRKLQIEAEKEYIAVVAESLELNKKVNKEAETSRTLNAANHAISEVTLSDQQMKADKLGLLATKQEEYNAQLARMRKGLAAAKPGENTSELEALLTDEAIAKHRAGLEKLYGEKTKAAKEHSMTMLNAQLKDNDAEYAGAVKHAAKMAALAQQQYANEVQVENDRFSMKRDNAKKLEGIGFLPLDEYVAHYEVLETAARLANAQQQASYDEQEAAAVKHTEEARKELDAFNAVTVKGNEKLVAALKNAEVKEREARKQIKDMREAANEKQDAEIAKAGADTLKAENADLNTQIALLTTRIAKGEAHLLTLTNTKEEIALIAAKLDEQKGIEISAELARAEASRERLKDNEEKLKALELYIEKLKTLITLRAKDKQVSLTTASSQVEFDRIKAVEAEWKKGWEAVNQVGMSVFVAWGENGQDMAKKIGDMLKKALLEAMYSATLRPIIFQVYAAVMGSGGAAGAAVASGIGGSSLLSTVFGNLFPAASAALSEFGTAALASAQTMIGMTGTTAQGLTYLSQAGYAGASSLSGFAASAASATPYVAVAALAITALKALTSYTVEHTGGAIVANVSGSGASSVANRTDYTQRSSGFLSGGTTHNSSWENADPAITKYIDTSIKAITEANKAYAEALGLNSDAITNYAEQLTIDISNMNAEQAQAAIDAGLAAFGARQAAAAFGEALQEYAKDGETAAKTLARLGTELTVVNAWAKRFGLTIVDVSLKGAAAADKLIEAFGGLDQFNSSMASFYSNYFTQAEQDAQAYAQVQQDLADQGFNISLEQLQNANKDTIRAWVLVAEEMYRAGTITAEQLAHVIADANALAPSIDRNEERRRSEEEAARRAAEQAAQEAQRKIDEERRAAEEAAAAAQRAAEEYAAAYKAAQEYIANIARSIKEFLAGLDAQAGGLQSYTKLAAAFSAQMVLARAGDRNALDNITGTASSLVEVIRSESSSQSEANLRIGRIRGQLSALPAQLSPEQFIVNGLIDTGGVIVDGGNDNTDALIVAWAAKSAELISRLTTGFDQIDLNKNGGIDFSELLTAFAGKATDDELKKLFAMLDANGDGAITAIELLNYNNNQAQSAIHNATLRSAENTLTTSDKIGNIVLGFGFDPANPLKSIFDATKVAAEASASIWDRITSGSLGAYVSMSRNHNSTGLVDMGHNYWYAASAWQGAAPRVFVQNMPAQARPPQTMTLASVDETTATTSELVTEIQGLREDNRAQALSIVQLQTRLTKVIERWDGNGMPEVRVVA